MDPLETPLHKAVKAGNIQDAKALILSGVEINARNRFTKTPLHYAVCQNMVPIVKLLLQNGADQTLGSPLVSSRPFAYIGEVQPAKIG